MATIMPPISIYRAEDEWRCDIAIGPGFHGVGDTVSEALVYAALEWRTWEEEKSFKETE